ELHLSDALQGDSAVAAPDVHDAGSVAVLWPGEGPESAARLEPRESGSLPGLNAAVEGLEGTVEAAQNAVLCERVHAARPTSQDSSCRVSAPPEYSPPRAG